MTNRSFLERVLHMWPVKVLSVGAAVLLYFFTSLLNLETRVVSVPISYSMAPGFTQASEFPTKARVRLRGQPGAVFGIDENELQVRADFSRFTREGQYQAALILKRTGAAASVDPLDVSVDPGVVAVTIEAAEARDVPVNVRLIGIPKPGFQLVNYTLSSSLVRVTGPVSRLRLVNAVDTEAVDLSGRSESFIKKVRLELPDPLLRVVGGDMPELRVALSASVNRRTFNGIKLSVIGLSPELALSRPLPEGSVTLQADSEVLSAVDPAQIRLLVDASQVGAAGAHALKTICDPPRDTMVVDVDPDELTLIVGPAAERSSP